MASPTVTQAVYNAATGVLTLRDGNLPATGYVVSDLTLTGDGGGSYTLTAASVVTGKVTGQQLAIRLSVADQLAVDGLLNRNGAVAGDGSTAYTLAAAAGWDGDAAVSGVAVSGVAVSVSVSGATAPKLAGVSYAADSGLFTFKGSHLSNHGASAGIALADLGFSAGGHSFTFGSGDTLGHFSANGFTVQLSPADEALVNAFADKNGKTAGSGAAYNLTAVAGWDSDGGAAIANLAVGVTGAAPALSAAAYNAGTGTLTLSGYNLGPHGYSVADFTLQGDGGGSYTLSAASRLSVLSAGKLAIRLSAADQLAVDGLLNRNGGVANDGSTAYSLSAAAGWSSGAAAVNDVAVSVSAVTAPKLTGVRYDGATGVFTFTGSHLSNHGADAGIALANLSLTAGSSSYTFGSGDTLGHFSAGDFTVTLSTADQALMNAFADRNGKSAGSGATYKLTAAAGWDSDGGVAISGVAVSVNHATTPTGTSSQIALGLGVSSIAVDAAGNVYFHSGTNGIQEVAAGSHALTTPAINNTEVELWSVASADDGGVYFSGFDPSSGAFQVGQLQSQQITASVQISGTSDTTAVDDGGNFYLLANSGTILEIAAGSQQTTTLATGSNGLPSSLFDIAVDARGNVYALGETDTGTLKIQEISATTHAVTTLLTGNAAATISSSVFMPSAITVDAAGNVYAFGAYYPRGASVVTDAIETIAAGTHALALHTVTGTESIAGATVDSAGHLYAYNASGAILEIVGVHP